MKKIIFAEYKKK